MATPRVWLVTGASSGLGKAVTEFALAKGDIVVATLRKPDVLHDLSESYPAERLLVLEVDVTKRADVDHAFARTKEVFGRLDVVFNNAGSGVFGEAETTPVDIAQAVFDVNFWGAVHVSQTAVKFFREVNGPGYGGVLLQNSSALAIASMPGLPFYCASKQALDGFSEALAMEILPQWNIKTCIIHTGSFATKLLASTTILPENVVYDDETSTLTFFRNMVTTPEFLAPGDPAKFAKTLYSIVESGNVPLHLAIGHDTLEIMQNKVESLRKVISESAPWSADLLRDDVIPPKTERTVQTLVLVKAREIAVRLFGKLFLWRLWAV